MLSALFISGDPFISGFPGPIQRLLWLSAQRFFDDDGDVSFNSVYFGTLELDLWLHFPSDDCDQFRDRGFRATDVQMTWRMALCIAFIHQHHHILHLPASNTCLSICRDIFDRDPG